MPEKNRGKPSHEEIRPEANFLIRPEAIFLIRPEIPGPDLCPELCQNQKIIQLKPKKKQSKPFRPELNQN